MSLLERLRNTHPRDSGYAEIANEAADEIERLNGVVLNAAQMVKNMGEACDAMRQSRDEARSLGRMA